MAASNYEDLRRHVDHAIECVLYGNNANVALECVDCNEVLLDFDNQAPPEPPPILRA